jgi:hypothetical protein
LDFFIRQRSLQNFTSSQTRSHFFRHLKGRPQVAQIFSGNCCFFTPRCSEVALGGIKDIRVFDSECRKGQLASSCAAIVHSRATGTSFTMDPLKKNYAFGA